MVNLPTWGLRELFTLTKEELPLGRLIAPLVLFVALMWLMAAAINGTWNLFVRPVSSYLLVGRLALPSLGHGAGRFDWVGVWDHRNLGLRDETPAGHRKKRPAKT